MELPRIPNDQLPKEIKEIVGDADAHFDLITDPRDIIDVPLNADEYYEGQHKIHQMLVESRKKLNEYRKQERHESKRNNPSSKTNHQRTQDQQEIVD